VLIAIAVPYKGSCVDAKFRPEPVTGEAFIQAVFA
jgi:hypothetical protein